MQSYSSPYTGAFNPNTGDKTWDQNLSTIGSVLFPDQSKIAQAYHYGSEARKAQIESNRALDQMAAGHAGLGMQFGLRPNPTYQSTPFGTIMNDPYENYGATQGPTAPPATPGAPVAPAQAPSTLGAAITQLPPEALSRGIVAGVENNTSSGTLPPMAPATAVSGPEPTTTTSNGMSPQNAPRNIQPLSVTSAGGGGRIYAPPGASDGTPSPVNFNFGQYVGLLVQSGMPFQAAQAAATATLGNMAKNGQMAVPLAENIAAFMGAPSMRNQVIANEGALATTRLTAGATVEAARVRERGETARAAMPTTFIPDPDPVKAAQGVGRYLPLGQQQGPGGVPGTNPAAVTATVTPGQYIDTNTGQPTTATAGTAIQRGLPAAPTGTDQQNAMLDAAIQQASRAGNQEEVKRLLNVKLRLAVLPKGPVEAKEADAQAQTNYRNDQAHYPQPDPTTAVDLYVKAPVMFKPEAERAITERMKELRTSDRWLALNTTDLRAEARQQLEDEDVLYKPEEINTLRRQNIRDPLGRDPRIQRVQPVGAAAPSDHMMIGLKPKPGAAGTTSGTTVSGAAPAGALGPAPAGSAEGAPVYSQGSRRIIGFNRGGWVMPNK